MTLLLSPKTKFDSRLPPAHLLLANLAKEELVKF